jgi:predicted MFS family arabinose efflux permease
MVSTVKSVSLWRNYRFQVLWTGSVFTFLGVEIADLGYPLAILALTGSPAAAAAFGVVQFVAALLCGLPAGAAADRFDHRRVLLATEGARAAAAGTVILAQATHHLTLIHLLVVAAVLGAARPFVGTARMSAVRMVVPAHQLTAALTQEEVRTNAAELTGPPLGGFLYGLGQVVPFVASTAAFALAWVCAFALRLPRRADASSGGGTRGGVFAGLAALWRNPFLRGATLLVIALNLVGAPLVLIIVVVLRQQRVAPGAIGIALAAFALGGLVGSALVRPLHHRLRPGTLLLTFSALQVPIIAALTLPYGPWWVGGLLFVAALGLPSLRVLVDVLIFRQVSDEQRGRTIAAVMTLFSIGPPIGIAAGGVLLELFTARTAGLVLAGTLAAGIGYAARYRALRGAQWPDA